MKALAAACGVAVGLTLTACGGGTPTTTPTPAATPAPSAASGAFPVYTQGSSRYDALLACLFDAGYRKPPEINQAAETATFRGASVPAITFKVNPNTPRTITPANATTEVVLHTAGCPGAF